MMRYICFVRRWSCFYCKFLLGTRIGSTTCYTNSWYMYASSMYWLLASSSWSPSWQEWNSSLRSGIIWSVQACRQDCQLPCWTIYSWWSIRSEPGGEKKGMVHMVFITQKTMIPVMLMCLLILLSKVFFISYLKRSRITIQMHLRSNLSSRRMWHC